MPPTTPSPLRPRCHAVALEPRLLFDGAAAVVVADHVADATEKSAQDVGAAGAERDSSGSAHAQDAHSETGAGAQSVLVVVDSRVNGWQSLVAELPANAMLRVIDQGESGIAAISEALAGRTGVRSIQIYSHGSQGSLTIGTSTLTTSNIDERATELHGWGEHLSSGADILLFGCEIASGQDGARFISRMASLTGADVAASTNPTGAAARGGDWTLEAATGSIEAQAALGAAQREGYSSLLAATSITDVKAAASHSGAEGLEFAVDGLTVSDADNPASMTLRIESTGGSARIADLHGATISGGTNGSADFTISGSLGQINDALATLKYTGDPYQNSAASGFAPKIVLTATDVTNGGSGGYQVTNLAVTPVNDAPNLDSRVALTVNEGGSAHLDLAQLATSAGVLDPDILTGQQVLAQQMMILSSLPDHGVLTYKGGAVAVGTVIPVSDLASLLYTHDGSDVTAPTTDSFGVTVNDGGGGSTSATLSVSIAPVNKAPAISGSFTLYEGQVKSVVPAIDLGDAADSLATSVITIDNVVTGGQGSFFIDANGDNKADAGEIVTGTRTVTAAELAQLKFAQNGYEPNIPGATSPSFRISVTDSGGGAGAAAKLTTAQTFELTVLPNNDDPTLTNAHADSGSALVMGEGATTDLWGMLTIHDPDRNPANPSQTTPTGQLVYTIGTRPTQGEIQLLVEGTTLGPNGDGWVVLGDGGRFTQADIDAHRVRYYQTTEVSDATVDSFTFTVRDSSSGLDVWNDPANPTGPREGGLRGAPTDAALAVQTFHLRIDAIDESHDNTYTGGPRPATSGYGGSDMTYNFFQSGSVTNGNGAAAWNESNLGAATGGYVIDDTMLAYTITRTDTRGTADPADDKTVTLPPGETVYTLTSLPANGSLQRFVGGAWQTLSTYATFTQADIEAGNIRFVSDGGETHASSFSYRVSDGTPNHYDGVFSIDVTPVNDRPTASGGMAQVAEGDGNSVHLGTGVLGMSDVDGSTTGAGGEGAADFLWFSVDTASVTHGKLQRWDGSGWVDVAAGEWLPSNLLTASAGGGTSGLRYVHDGSEPLTYATVGLASFTYRVRDDLGAPGSPFVKDNTTPVADGSGTPQSNLGAAATATIRVIPVNDAPQVANRPGDADPTIGATIAGGGGTTGVNEILSAVEGATTTITGADLTAIDPDNTTVQRQFKITSAPTQGVLLLGGKQIGVGSTFTQADIDSGKLSYKHNGNEVGAATTDGLGTYNDKFLFDVSDGAATDSGNAFLISLTPANDAPTVKASAPSLDVTAAGGNYVNVPSGTFTVADPDLDALAAGETDFLRVEVKMVDSGGALVLGGLISYSAADPTGVNAMNSGKGTNTLVVQGTKAQVQAVLDSLKVGNTADRDTATDKLVVTVDDRLYDGSGVLTAGANGGTVNQDGTAPSDAGNRASASMALYSSNDNDAPSITNSTPSRAATEDTALTLDGFTLSDPDSFDKPVTVKVELFTDAGRTALANATSEGKLTSSGGTGVTVTGSGTNTLTLTGTMAQVQAVLNAVKFQAATDVNDQSFYVHATFTDYAHAGGSKTGETDIAITTVMPVNDKPVLTVPGSALLLEGGDSVAVTGITFQDNKDLGQGGADSFTVTITAPDAGDVLSATATGGAGVSFDSATRVLTVTGTQADVNATLATLIYKPSDPNVDGARVLTVLVDDHENGKESVGVGGNNTASGSVTVFISSMNDPAQITAGNVTVAEGAGGATVVLDASKGNFVVADADNNGGLVSATVTVSKGTITGVGGSGGTVTGTGGSSIEITGVTLAELNARLKALTITYPGGNPDWNGSFDVTVAVNDGGHVGSRPTILTGDTNSPKANPGDYDYADGASNKLVTTRTITVTVTPVNDAPTRAGAAGATLPGVAEDAPNPSGTSVADLFGSKFSDAKDAVTGGSSANEMLGIAVTANAATPAQGVWQYSTDGGANWTNLPAASDTGAVFLNNSDLVRFKPAADYHGAPGGLTARLVDDSGGAKASGTAINATTSTACSDTGNAVTLGVSVTPVNDAPTLGGTASHSTAEDTTGTGKSAAAILGELTYGDATDNRSGITGGGNTATPGNALAIVGNAATSAQGTWQYTLDGSTWIDVPSGAGLGENSAIVLSTGDANHQVRFVPAADYSGTPGQLTLRAADGNWDGQTGVRDISGDLGGAKAWSASTGALAVTVTPVNDPARITADDVTVTEGASGTTVVLDATRGGFTVTDIDNGGGLVSATVTVSKGVISAVGGTGGTVAGTGTATVTVSGATLAELNARLQALTVTYPGGDADWNGSFDVTVKVNDGGHGGSRPTTLTGDTGDPSANPGDYGYADGASSQLTTTRTITVTVGPVNDAPTLGGLGAHGYTEGAAPTAIGAGLILGDPELGALAGGAGDWGGATLTISRQGGANAQDVFSASGGLSALTPGGTLSDGGTVIGTVTANSGGALTITFASGVTTAQAQAAMEKIAYSNTKTSLAVGASENLTLDWVLNDQNSNASGSGTAGGGQNQGSGGRLFTTISQTITLAGANSPPAATDDGPIATVAGKEIPSIPVLSNDSDPDGDPLSVTGINGAPVIPGGGVDIPEGRVTLNADGTLRFTPGPGAKAGDLTFTYTISDGNGGTSTAQVTLRLTAPEVVVSPPAPPAPPAPTPELQAKAPLVQESSVREPSVFLDGGAVDRVMRLPIPLHPVAYVNNQVNVAQEEREANDARMYGSPELAAPGIPRSLSIGRGLGMDHSLFVTPEVRWSQDQGERLHNRVQGRDGRLTLTSDWRIGAAESGQPVPSEQRPPPDTGETSRPEQGGADGPEQGDQPGEGGAATAPNASGQRPRTAAPSFSDQVRRAGSRPVLSPRPSAPARVSI